MTPTVRISLGLVALTVSILLLADAAFNIFPDRTKPLLEARMQYCESIATQYSAIVNEDDGAGMGQAMQRTLGQNPDILSLAMRAANGQTVASTPEHETFWADAKPDSSTPTHVRIPVFAAGEQWGEVEIAFKPLTPGGWWAWLDSPLYRLVLITALAGFALYMLFMRRTLRYLDPNAVVPGRVRAALDQLVEGVVLLDTDLCVVLANKSFAAKLDTTPEAMTGMPMRRLDWLFDEDAETEELPWELVRGDGARRTGTRLILSTPSQGERTMTAHAAPVVDGSTNLRGIMATFDDISDIERMNTELARTVQRLELAQAEIRTKNEELEILATRDSLTGALNRRAFFEKLNMEFEIARRDGLPLSCIMADIDHFKAINDNFGHAVGDEVIKLMATTLEVNRNANGAVGRYGGEEFCVVLPGLDQQAAARVADQIRTAFASASAADDSPTSGKAITASFGVSAVDLGAASAEAMVDEADQALYISKTSGRDRVTAWSPAADAQAVGGA